MKLSGYRRPSGWGSRHVGWCGYRRLDEMPPGSAFQGCVSLDELHPHSRPPEKNGGDAPKSLTPVMRKEASIVRFLLLRAPQACRRGTINFLKYPFFQSDWIYLPVGWKDLQGLNKTRVFKLLVTKTFFEV